MITFVEVCSGGGGLSCGFINKGMTPILLNDYDKNCCETLKLNHPSVTVIHEDMNNLLKNNTFLETLNKHKQIDLLCGGIPCQSYSIAGNCEGLKDTRGKLLYSFVELLKYIKPKMFLIENVKGMVIHNKGKTLDIIINTLKECGYNISYQILNANDYDVAQNRQRLIIVGIQNKINKPYVFPPTISKKLVLRDVLSNIEHNKNKGGYSYSDYKKSIMNLIPQGGCWIDLPKDKQIEYMGNSINSSGGKRGIAKRLSMNHPSPTLTCSPCQKQTERCHPLETRPLNIAEYARIQSFPDDYVFQGSISSRYKQIGNAVPVKLAEAIAQSIIDTI